jgi:hypothetical protein
MSDAPGESDGGLTEDERRREELGPLLSPVNALVRSAGVATGTPTNAENAADEQQNPTATGDHTDVDLDLQVSDNVVPAAGAGLDLFAAVADGRLGCLHIGLFSLLVCACVALLEGVLWTSRSSLSKTSKAGKAGKTPTKKEGLPSSTAGSAANSVSLTLVNIGCNNCWRPDGVLEGIYTLGTTQPEFLRGPHTRDFHMFGTEYGKHRGLEQDDGKARSDRDLAPTLNLLDPPSGAASPWIKPKT